MHGLTQYNYQVFVEMEPNRRRDEDKFQVIDQEERKKYDKRTLVQVFATDLQNIVYFFTPLIVIHNVAWRLKPILTDDPKSPWEIIWHFLLDCIGEDKFNLYVWGTFSVACLVQTTVALVYALMDFTQRPKFLMKYKVQLGKNEPLKVKKFLKVMGVVALNELLTLAFLIVNFDHWKVQAPENIRPLPDVYTTFGHIFVAMVAHDICFYHFHRFLHHRKLYKHIHKVHHEWQSPVAATATYAHPLEHILTGIVSPSVGPMLTGCPLTVNWIWLAWLIIQVMNDHSGYHFPLVFSPEFHDYHHLKFHTSYGWLTFWDWFYGTDIEFQKTEVHKDRHFRIHSTQSAREYFPDPVQKKKVR